MDSVPKNNSSEGSEPESDADLHRIPRRILRGLDTGDPGDVIFHNGEDGGPIGFTMRGKALRDYLGYDPDARAAAEEQRRREIRDRETKSRLDAEQWEREKEQRQAELVAERLAARLAGHVPVGSATARPNESKRRAIGEPGRPRKQPTYRRFCELWREHTASYEPELRQSASATERSFLSWIKEEYPRERVGKTKLAELKGEWGIRGWAFPPTGC